ncbi:hypothetical protein MBH78_01005 [Oceanimonas sp. NS1]|nr:hypothetical protein [Oceanimonas sp. NS1]
MRELKSTLDSVAAIAQGGLSPWTTSPCSIPTPGSRRRPGPSLPETPWTPRCGHWKLP